MSKGPFRAQDPVGYRSHTHDAGLCTQTGLGQVQLLELCMEDIHYPGREVVKIRTHFLENKEPLE